MAKLRLPCLAQMVVRSASAGWVAAIYGALYIYATADFAATGSFWIFGWPFLAALVVATLTHLLLAGIGGTRLPSPVGWVNAINHVTRPDVRPEAAPHEMLALALAWFPSAPVVSTLCAMAIAAWVVVAMVALEWLAAGSTRNLGPVAIGGLLATLLYGAVTYTASELLVAVPCQRLRLAAVRRGLDPYVGRTVDTRVRVAILAAPATLALVVAPRLTANLHDAWLAHATIVFLATGLSVSLAWMHAVAIRHAAADLGEAASRLIGNGRVTFLTGAVDAHLVAMARAFNAAADQVDRSLQNAAARYAALFEGAGDAILLIDPATGAIIEANRQAQALTGLGERALKASRFEWLFRPGTRVELPDVQGRRRELCGMTVVRSDGSECPVDVAVSFVSLAQGTVLQAILHDVSQRERIERDLRDSVRRLQGLYQLAVSLGGSVEDVAEQIATSLARLLDVPLVAVERHVGDEMVMLAMYENGIVTRGQRDLLAGTPCGTVREARKPCLFANVSEGFPDDAFLLERGVTTYAGVPILERGGAVAGAVVIMDVRPRELREEDVQLLTTFADRLARTLDDEQHQRERESLVRQLTEQNIELRAAKERLTESDRVKSIFMGMMSHELRTPLNIFHGYTDLLLDAARENPGARVADHREVLERMLRAAGILTNLVEDTLSVLRLESAGVQVNREEIALASLFEELQGAERFLRPASSVAERWLVEPGLPSLTSDRLKLRQILTNLVGNARKFTTAGTITVQARSAGPGRVALSVEDTGCGIAEDDLPYVFELYRQAGDGGARNGCGLGLFIVRRYCEVLGGRIDVASEPGHGSRFTVVLPCEMPAAPALDLPQLTA